MRSYNERVRGTSLHSGRLARLRARETDDKSERHASLPLRWEQVVEIGYEAGFRKIAKSSSEMDLEQKAVARPPRWAGLAAPAPVCCERLRSSVFIYCERGFVSCSPSPCKNGGACASTPRGESYCKIDIGHEAFQNVSRVGSNLTAGRMRPRAALLPTYDLDQCFPTWGPRPTGGQFDS
ncbi:hypothetical protein EVAR_60547_1 [Eumeta japonica]|uniref:Uncharacterized protein n=1 Tax=Eumeta variegata TaxID=151549 RepID=A0A4C1YTM1_EUMVA|nr:hypothetical protein EVAR_60547_1 [Eumeta japonica]